MAGGLAASISKYPPGTLILSIARFSSWGSPTGNQFAPIMTFEPDTVQALGVGLYFKPTSWKGAGR